MQKALRALALVSLLPGPARAQDTVEAALRRLNPGACAVLVRQEDTAALAALWDEDALRLRLENQAPRIPLGPRAAAGLWKDHGWGTGPGWILVDSRGGELDAGLGLGYGARVLAALREKGVVPRWEARRAFLKEHPENGEAWWEELYRAYRLAHAHMLVLAAQGRASRSGAESLDFPGKAMAFAEADPEAAERLADQVFGEVASALEGAFSVEGWWRTWFNAAGPLVMEGAQASPRIREVCARLAADLEGTLAQGGRGFPMEEWLPSLRVLAGRPLRELPGQVVIRDLERPSFGLVRGCLNTLAVEKDWLGMLAFLDDLGLREDAWFSAEGWEQRCLFRGYIEAWKARPLVELGRIREARDAVNQARFWGLDGGLDGILGFLLGAKALGDPTIREALKEPARPRPPRPPLPPPPRLALLGAPPWRRDWEALRASGALLPWSPAELGWTELAPAPAEALRARMGWGPEPRWALLLGDAPVASGTRCPAPALVAGILQRERPSKLMELDGILERHPGHLGARQARLGLLKARMPDKRLEPLLAEDARAAHLPGMSGSSPYGLDFGPDAAWKPDPALWQWSAQQVLPGLERLLRSWPSAPDPWKAWLAWARFHPDRPSVVALARTLVLWTPEERWMGQLPLDVLQAVTEELRRDRNYPELARWLGAAWEARSATVGRGLPSWQRPEWQAMGPALVQPLAETLRLLGLREKALEVEKTYRNALSPE
ncbi:hypothetical protein [Mesoterricola silvestris]|uniref:Uncharacterized protein n=1 Tax=Mesoterricola silvestris TaxID=2927979 RepID=A0AA48K8X4_9BACT|nr:hypothetical protein [Mesoterricola silvestris]BDU71737.1 hypothetical protein METEAL_09110 [Mesoterricola silvestris]